MTGSSEYAALAASRNLRAINMDEGRRIFSALMKGRPASAVNILLAEGEIDYYRPLIDGESKALPVIGAANSIVKRWDLSTRRSPFLREHLISGVPALPGAFITCMLARTAKELRPGLFISSFLEARFLRFIKLFEDKDTRIRIAAKVVREDAAETLMEMKVLSDFIHESGKLLQKDRLHNSVIVRMTKGVNKRPPSIFSKTPVKGISLPDPYIMSGSPVELKGSFDSMERIILSEEERRAAYLFKRRGIEGEYSHMLPAAVLLDAFWRYSAIVDSGDGFIVSVPRSCASLEMFYDFTDFNNELLLEPLFFRAANPEREGGTVHVGPMEIRNGSGEVLVRMKEGECHEFGTVDYSREKMTGTGE